LLYRPRTRGSGATDVRVPKPVKVVAITGAAAAYLGNLRPYAVRADATF